jgi:hypothetical protein
VHVKIEIEIPDGCEVTDVEVRDPKTGAVYIVRLIDSTRDHVQSWWATTRHGGPSRIQGMPDAANLAGALVNVAIDVDGGGLSWLDGAR